MATRELAVLQHVLAGGRAEVLRGNGTPAVGSGHLAGGAQDDEGGYAVGAGGGVAQVAAQAGPALYLDAAYQGRAVDEARIGL